MCPPSHACALTYKRRFWTCIRGNLPVTVKPDRIVPQLVNQHRFTSTHDIIKHKTREELRRATPIRRMSRGIDDPRPQIRVSPEEAHENVRIISKLACVPSICVCVV